MTLTLYKPFLTSRSLVAHLILLDTYTAYSIAPLIETELQLPIQDNESSFSSKQTNSTVKHGGAHITLWEYSTITGFGRLVKIKHKINAVKYSYILNCNLVKLYFPARQKITNIKPFTNGFEVTNSEVANSSSDGVLCPQTQCCMRHQGHSYRG